MQRFLPAITAALVLIVASLSAPPAAANADRECFDIRAEGRAPVPPRGSAVALEVVVNADCSLTYLPPRVIPSGEVPAPPSGYASRSIRGALHGSEGSTRSAVDPDYHIVNRVP